MPFLIKPPNRGELSRLQFIERSAALRFANTNHSYIARSEVTSLAKLKRHLDNATVLAAYEPTPANQLDDGPIAFILWSRVHSRDEPYLFIEEMDVLPEYAGHRLGAQLMEKIKDSSVNPENIWLTTFSDIAWNAPYYEKLGFTRVNESEAPPWVVDRLHRERSAGLKNRTAMRKHFS